MKSIYEFFITHDPDSKYLIMSFEILCSNVIAILVWLYINSDSINMIFASTAAFATMAVFNIPKMAKRFKVMLFIAAAAGGLQFGLTVFIHNKILILIFLFCFTVLLFSIKGYQYYAALSLFPAITVVGNNVFSYEAAINRCFYQIIAFLISFSVTVIFSLIFSKFMIRQSIISFLYYLLQQVKKLKTGEKIPHGFSTETMILQKMGSTGLYNCLHKEYLLLGQNEFASENKKILYSLIIISRGLLLLRNLKADNEVVAAQVGYIEYNLEKYLINYKNRKKYNLEDVPDYKDQFNNDKYSTDSKNIYAFSGIIKEMQNLRNVELK